MPRNNREFPAWMRRRKRPSALSVGIAGLDNLILLLGVALGGMTVWRAAVFFWLETLLIWGLAWFKYHRSSAPEDDWARQHAARWGLLHALFVLFMVVHLTIAWGFLGPRGESFGLGAVFPDQESVIALLGMVGVHVFFLYWRFIRPGLGPKVVPSRTVTVAFLRIIPMHLFLIGAAWAMFLGEVVRVVLLIIAKVAYDMLVFDHEYLWIVREEEDAQG